MKETMSEIEIPHSTNASKYELQISSKAILLKCPSAWVFSSKFLEYF